MSVISFTQDDILAKIRSLPTKELLLTAILENVAELGWVRRYLGAAEILVYTTRDAPPKRFRIDVDLAGDIFNIPEAAREALLAVVERKLVRVDTALATA